MNVEVIENGKRSGKNWAKNKQVISQAAKHPQASLINRKNSPRLQFQWRNFQAKILNWCLVMQKRNQSVIYEPPCCV